MFTNRDESLTRISRFICIAYILIVFLSSLTVFFSDLNILNKVLNFITSQISTILLTVSLYIAKRNNKAGGYLLIISSVCFSVYLGTYKDILCFVTMTFPLIAAGIMYVINGINNVY